MGLLAYRSREAFSVRVMLPRPIVCGIETYQHSNYYDYRNCNKKQSIMAQEYGQQRTKSANALTHTESFPPHAQPQICEKPTLGSRRRSTSVVTGGKLQPTIITTTTYDDDDVSNECLQAKDTNKDTRNGEPQIFEVSRVILYPSSEDADSDSEDKHYICRRKSYDTRGRAATISNPATVHKERKFVYLRVHGHDDIHQQQQQQEEDCNQVGRPRSRSPRRLSNGYDRWSLFDKPIIRPGCPLLSVTNTDSETKYPDDLYYYPDDWDDDDDDDDYDSD